MSHHDSDFDASRHADVDMDTGDHSAAGQSSKDVQLASLRGAQEQSAHVKLDNPPQSRSADTWEHFENHTAAYDQYVVNIVPKRKCRRSTQNKMRI